MGVNGIMLLLVAQLYLTLCDPMDCSLPGSSVHGILQARILEWAAMPFSRGSSWPRDRTRVSWIAGRFFTIWATRGAPRALPWVGKSQSQKGYIQYDPMYMALGGVAVQRGMWIFVPQPGIEPTSPALEAWNLNHWTAREVPTTSLKCQKL